MGDVLMGRPRSGSRKPLPLTLTKELSGPTGLKHVHVIASGAGGDGIIANRYDNGALVGHLVIHRRVAIGQAKRNQGKPVVEARSVVRKHITRLDDVMVGMKIHMALILAELAEISGDDQELIQARTELETWLNLNEPARRAVAAQLRRLSGHYDQAFNPARMEAYFQLSAANTLRDRRGWVNIGATLARLVAVCNRLQNRSRQLEVVMQTNISRQINWLAPLVRNEEQYRIQLLEWLGERQTLDPTELMELHLRADRLLWPNILAIWHLRCETRQHYVYQPELLTAFRQRLEFDQHYSWLMEPVRPIASWTLNQLDALDAGWHALLQAELSERILWLSRQMNGPYAELVQRLAEQMDLMRHELDDNPAAARKAAKQFKADLRYRGLVGYWPIPTW